MIRTLALWGVDGQRDKAYTGVWIDAGLPTARKICAMGVKTSRWVTMHGQDAWLQEFRTCLEQR